MGALTGLLQGRSSLAPNGTVIVSSYRSRYLISSFLLFEKYCPGPGFFVKVYLVKGAFISFFHISALPVPLKNGF
jgi:hypothetical protein